MIIDAHAHVFPKIHGRVAAGPTRGLRYGQIKVGTETLRLLPPFGEKIVFTPEMLIAHMDWAGWEVPRTRLSRCEPSPKRIPA